VIEIFEHLILIERSRSRDLNWHAAIVSLPHTDSDTQKLIQREIQALSEFGKRRKSGFDMVTEDATVLLIGQSLHLWGDRWAEAKPDKLRWLEENGITRDEAVERFLRWREEMNRHPFWQFNQSEGEDDNGYDGEGCD
jgi:hypothetical protein